MTVGFDRVRAAQEANQKRLFDLEKRYTHDVNTRAAKAEEERRMLELQAIKRAAEERGATHARTYAHTHTHTHTQAITRKRGATHTSHTHTGYQARCQRESSKRSLRAQAIKHVTISC